MSNPLSGDNSPDRLSMFRIGNLSYQREFLRAVEISCQLAHAVNPRSWSIALDPPWIVVLVGKYATTVVGGDRGAFIALGSLEQEERDSLKEGQIYEKYPFEGFYLKGLDGESFETLFRKYEKHHKACIELLAQGVRSQTNQNYRHQQQLAEQIGEALGTTLPSPGYYAPSSSAYSNYWRYTINRECWKQDLKEQFLSSQDWPTTSTDLSNLPEDFGAFTRELTELTNVGPVASRRLWNLSRGMKAGDRVLAHQGSEILGVGTVTGDYAYYPDEPHRRHRRDVLWTPPSATQKKIPKHLVAEFRSWDIAPISYSVFMRLTEMPSNPNTRDSLEVRLDTQNLIQYHFEQRGLSYTSAQVATFYTALQTKGLVVLSGISGTGKSKIAQHFVDMLPAPEPIVLPPPPDRSVMSFVTNPDQNWAAVPASQAELFPPVPLDYKHSVVFEYGGNSYSGFAVTKVVAFGKPTLYLTLGDELIAELRESNPKQRVYATTSMAKSGDKIDTVRLALEPRTLVGSQAAAGSQLPETVALKNSLFLAVRPDWRDSTSLLGYYNPLTETYEWTEFLRFLLRAVESYRRRDGLAWFVILDEMNLAHVEYYFADLLSIIESGRDDDGWSQEPIRLTYPDAKTDNPPPHEIHLPPNLYIIGTVNMDETTHAFSPKVLDRAFTIELTEVDFSDYPPAPAAEGMELADEERQSLLRAFTRDGAFARIDKGEIRKAVDNHPEIRDWLQALNTELAKHQFQFGYRVFDEIAQFVHNAEINGMFADDSMGTTEPWLRAFDHAVYMKVLPKFNGSHARLQGPLTALLQWAKGSTVASIQENDPNIGADGISVPLTTPRLPRVHDRAKRMLDLLEANGFVSFG